MVAAFKAFRIQKENNESEVASEEVLGYITHMEEAESPKENHKILMNGLFYIGILEIPSQSLRLPIGEVWTEYSGAKSPCRYAGSIENDDIIICGHNNRAHFSKIKRLSEGEEVLFTRTNKEKITYIVNSIETIGGDDVDGMLNGDWDMTLFTCTFGGKDRVAIRLSRKL